MGSRVDTTAGQHLRHVGSLAASLILTPALKTNLHLTQRELKLQPYITPHPAARNKVGSRAKFLLLKATNDV